MNKKPIILRTIIAAVVILVFALSMIPLAERPFYDTFKSMVKKDTAVAQTNFQTNTVFGERCKIRGVIGAVDLFVKVSDSVPVTRVRICRCITCSNERIAHIPETRELQ